MTAKRSKHVPDKTVSGCGCGMQSGVTIIDVSGCKVGLRDLDKIFSDYKEKNVSPEEIDPDKLLDRFKESNYIVSSKDEEYKNTLLAEYRRYWEKEL